MNTIILSGSCYWCMEAIFRSLNGVTNVVQGWVKPLVHLKTSHLEKGHAKTGAIDNTAHPNHGQAGFYEGILIEFDANVIPLAVLIDIHLHTHSATSTHHLRERYPSAIHTDYPAYVAEIEQIIASKQAEFNHQLVTQARLFSEFTPSEQSMQDYFYQNPEKAFCQATISPKLKHLLSEYGQWVKEDKAAVISRQP